MRGLTFRFDLQEAAVKLLAKFNLVFILVFGLGMALISYNAHNFLIGNARQQVLDQAQLMSASASATKDYTDQQVSPLLEKTPRHNTNFLPQTIPFYAANATFRFLRSTHPDYTLREAALNPTNLDDRAEPWEADLIHYFRDNPHEGMHVGERETPVGPLLYVASPIAADQGCLACHSLPSLAPKPMVDRYGEANGFGWKPHEVVGAQVISVPMSVPIAIANRGFRDLLIGLGSVFLLTILLIDLAMYLIVIRPLRKVSKNADIISKGDVDMPPLEVRGHDEIAEVTASFNRMHTSLVKTFELLNN
jgi:protein-histidine pros-kinase